LNEKKFSDATSIVAVVVFVNVRKNVKFHMIDVGMDIILNVDERLTANAKVATVLGSIPASSDTVESEGRQMKQW
jgi:hypothetical protein